MVAGILLLSLDNYYIFHCHVMPYSGLIEGRKELGFTSLSTAYVISRRDRNQEPGIDSLLFTNSSKGSFCCRRTIGSPPQHLYSDQANPLGDPAETQTFELTLWNQAS